MSDSRKHWTKSVVLGSLEKIDQELKTLDAVLDRIEPEVKKIEGLADGGGQMPAPLRRRLGTTGSKVRGLITDLKNWTVTTREKAIAEFGRQEEERAPVRTPGDSIPKKEGRAKAQVVGKPVTRPPTRSSSSFYLEDGRGPFDTIQEAFDALGLPKEQRPKHNRYDRLSQALKSKILQRGEN